VSDEAAQADDPQTPEVDIKSTHVWKEWKHSAPLIGCRCGPTGRYVFASAMDSTIQRWDLDTDQHAVFGGHDSWLRAIGFSPDGKQTFTADYDGKMCFWETESESAKPTREMAAHDGWVRWLSVHPDGKLLATAGNDLLVKIWSTETTELLHTFPGHENHIYSTLFHPAGEWLLTGDLNGVVNQWEIASGKLVRSFDAKDLRHGVGGVRCLAVSPDGEQLACGGLHKASNALAGVQEPLVLIFDWESGEQLHTHEATEIDRGIARRVFYQADGTLVGASGGGAGGFLLFWKTEKTEFHKFKLPATLHDMDLHPNGLDIVTAHHDGHIRISRMAAKA